MLVVLVVALIVFMVIRAAMEITGIALPIEITFIRRVFNQSNDNRNNICSSADGDPDLVYGILLNLTRMALKTH